MTKPLLLVVDDEPDMAEFVGEVGESVGFEVMTATNGDEFQKIYKSESPAGIVMDIVMPVMDGIELTTWLSEQNCNTPIIFISGYDRMYLETARKLGSKKGCHVVGALTKPFSSEDLEPLLQQII